MLTWIFIYVVFSYIIFLLAIVSAFDDVTEFIYDVHNLVTLLFAPIALPLMSILYVGFVVKAAIKYFIMYFTQK